jgi:5-methylcytosine-specific restriction enzyme B
MNDLANSDDLRNACDALGRAETWSPARTTWVNELAGVLEWVRQASFEERTPRDFQHRLWEENKVAAVGQGDIPLDGALDDPGFRRWVAERSIEPLPATSQARLVFLTDFFDGLKDRLGPHVTRTPRLKIFRVLAALYPEAMTTVGSAGALQELVRAMGGDRGLTPVGRHLWVRERLDAVIGPAAPESRALAERMSLAWMLYDRFVKSPAVAVTQSSSATNPDDSRLVPLPAARRRRGMTAIRGGFQGALSTLEFVRDGVTRQELLDFLRTASPGVKDSSLSTMINVLQSELGVVRVDGDKYVRAPRHRDRSFHAIVITCCTAS